jgi:acetylornithine deacetylase
MDSLEHLKELLAFESTSVLSNVGIADHIEETLRKLEFAIERIEYADANGVRKVNVVGKKGAGVGGMAYFGHTDVVPANTWFSDEHDAFTPTVKGDKLYGRGASDMKGSIACMLAAAGQFSAAELKKPVYVTCTADEEIGFGGAAQVAQRSEFFREMIEGGANGVIGEPTMLEVVYAHKGAYGLRAVSRGRAAHSSTREGLNANLAMIPFLAEMKRIYEETEADTAWHNDEFAPPTVSWNIGINDHTKAINVTPPQSICTINFRPMPGQDAEVLVERARRAAEKCGIEFEAFMRAEPLYVDPDSQFVREVLQLAGRQSPRSVSYGTDGAMLTELEKLVVFGPGDIAQGHTHDEWITLEQLRLGSEMYAKLIRHWCC